MADTKISALTSATTPLAGTEVLPIVQSGTTKKVSVADLTAGRDVSASSITTSKAGLAGDFYNSTGSGVVEILRLRWNNSGTGGALTLTNQVGTVLGQIANGGDANGTYLAFSSYSNSTALTEWARFGGNGNLAFSVANKGINFTANTGAAGMTSQLLNWYEEGTWTPSFVGTGTLTTVTYDGRYTRVGRQVTCTAIITVTDWGTFSALSYIGGLPFTVNSSFPPAVGVLKETYATGKTGSFTAVNPTQLQDISYYDNSSILATGTSKRTYNITVVYFV
jgi:hypothetical protein